MSEALLAKSNLDFPLNHSENDVLERLTEALKRRGVALPPKAELLSAVLKHDADGCMDYADQLRAPPAPICWYWLAWSEDILKIGLGVPDEVQIATCLAEAVSEALGVLDRAMVPITDVSSDERAEVILSSYVGQVARIGKLQLEEPNLEARARYPAAFSKVKRLGRETSALQALRSVPGLAAIVTEETVVEMKPEGRGVRGALMAATPNSLAWNMGLVLAEVGIELKQSVLLEVTAEAYRFESWNHMKAREQAARGRRPAVLEFVNHFGSGRTQRWFFDSFWDALPQFAKRCAAADRVQPLAPPKLEAHSYRTGMPGLSVTYREWKTRQLESGGEWHAPRAISLHGAEAAYFAESNKELVEAAVSDPGGPVSGLRKLLAKDAQEVHGERERYARMGLKQDRVRSVLDWVFTLPQNPGMQHQIEVEVGGEMGRRRQIGCTPAYKAQFQMAFNGVWVLLGNYESEVVAALPGLTEQEVRELARWAEVENASSITAKKTVRIGDGRGVRKAMLRAGVKDAGPMREVDASLHEGAELVLDLVRNGRSAAVELIAPGVSLVFDSAGARWVFSEAGLPVLSMMDASRGRSFSMQGAAEQAARAGGDGREAALRELRREIAEIIEAEKGRRWD